MKQIEKNGHLKCGVHFFSLIIFIVKYYNMLRKQWNEYASFILFHTALIHSK